MAPDRTKLVAEYLKQKAILNPHIQKIVLYGSRARGDQKDRSDFDIAVYAPQMVHGEWARFYLDVQENIPTLCGLDLVLITDSISDELKLEIEKEGTTLYEQNKSKNGLSKRSVVAITNLAKVVTAMEKSVQTPVKEDRDLSGIIKDFEIAFEVSWKTLKKVLQDQGVEANSPKEVLSQAYQLKFIDDEESWLEILKDRNLTVHVYDHVFVTALIGRIKNQYLSVFHQLLIKLKSL